MERGTEEFVRRHLYVYDLPEDILVTLTRKDTTNAGPVQETFTQITEINSGIKEENSVVAKTCSLCKMNFAIVEDQRSHVKSDLHGYNLKLRMRGGKVVSEDEFEKLVEDLDESLSGSDVSISDEEEGGSHKGTTLSTLLKKKAAISITNEDEDASKSNERKRGSGRSPLIWFTTPVLPVNTYLGTYRAIFTDAEQENEREIVDILRKKQLTPKSQPKTLPGAKAGVLRPETYKGPHLFLCMIGGGHFAAMVVSLAPKQSKNSSSSGPLSKEAVVLAHKTFHRYTTRRKQGGSQAANDSAKGAAHSAGSSLRRYNEQALTEEVRQLLQDWRGMIDTAELLFIRATGTMNRKTLFGPYERQILRQNDSRIRGFPFSTRRATQNELMRSFIELTRAKILEINPSVPATPSTPTAKIHKEHEFQKPTLSEEDQIALLHTSQLANLIRRSKLPPLLSYLSSNSISPNFLFQPQEQYYHTPTPLHLAASLNSPVMVEGLLLKANADPTVKNNDKKTPYMISGDRRTREGFRIARGVLGEEIWAWEEAGVGPPVGKEEVEKREKLGREEEQRREMERRREEEKRLRADGSMVDNNEVSRRQERARNSVLGIMGSGKISAEERRKEEAKGLSEEARLRVERERRARAAEERLGRLHGGG